VLQALGRNFGLKLLALAVAVTAWAYFRFSAAPSLTAHFDQQLTVPVVVTGLQPGLVAQYDQHTALVTVETPRSGAAIKAEQVEAVLDISDRNAPGIVNIGLKIVPPDLVIKSLSPASVTLTIDRVASRGVPVSIDYSGGSGKLVVVSSSVSPTVTTVRGIASELAKVATVKVEIPLAGSKPGELDAMVRPIATDARGEAVAGVDVSPNLVRVHARFGAGTNSAGVKP
jgi:YbbR domain-containing protein